MSTADPPAVPQPTTDAGREGLAALLADPARAIAAFDFDGTLAPIVPDPADARPHPEAVAALGALGSSLGRVAVITGRPAAVAVDYGGFAGVAGLEGLVVLGHYGLECWQARTGEVVAPPAHPGVTAARESLPALLQEWNAPDGTWIEDKGSAVAVHTRRCAEPDAALAALREPLARLAVEQGLVTEPGRLVVELRPPGVDKGGALRGLADAERPSAVLFAGDDLGDLAAFDAVDELRAEGVPGLLVCSGSEEVEAVAARADLVVDGPAGLVALLRVLASALHRRA